jgi:cell division protein FtsA
MPGRPLNSFAVGLDVGTTKVCAVVGAKEAGTKGIRVLAIGNAPSTGLKKGIVVDIERTVSSIKSAVQDAEGKAGLAIESAYIGIAGGHIKGFQGYSATGLRKGEIREEDIDRLLDSAGAMYVPVDREVLHIIPAGFKIDGHNGVTNPLGMYGERLEAQIHIITGAVTSVQNLVKCCELAGIKVNDIILEPLASSKAVLREGEIDEGVVLVDIGGGTTDIAVYRGGVLRHTSVIAIGGNHITNDIAIGLGIPFHEAERIKMRCGHAFPEMAQDDLSQEMVIDAAVTPSRNQKVHPALIGEIMQGRCDEIICLVKKELEVNSCTPLCASIVLTGGTSLLRGIRELSEELFRLPVRVGMPEGVLDRDLVESPIYSTAVGLVSYGLRYNPQPDLSPSGIVERMRNWVNSLFK